MTSSLNTRFHLRLSEIDATAWNALLPDDNPFLDHAFLSGLEQHGCLRPGHGWIPHHLGLYRNGKLVAAAPAYVKTNSHGEYVFDWSWANAYTRHGLDYYPKLLCAVPYSPVTGPRLLTGNGPDAGTLRRELVGAMRAEAERQGWSSAHLNFAAEADASAFADDDWLPRFDWQFHWSNQGWRDFPEFLQSLTAKKRKNIRQERERVSRAHVDCEIVAGHELTDADWTMVHELYLSTFSEKGNYPALTEGFFRHLGTGMPGRVLVVRARRGGRWIAAALLLRSRDTLYGRYWGCSENVPGLHFEVCYYQGIEHCLRNGLQRFEPGAQGEHKLARGFLPTMTRSFHWLADLRFRSAVRDALAHEGTALHAYHAELMAHSPYVSDSFPARPHGDAEGGCGPESRPR
ncbi:MAG: GNAT family N-acetyltransferase [Rudaea sp.]|nr:GNAT family N-acetyltransferase [Rudaea sp.]